MTTPAPAQVTGSILAGGRAQRMQGQDKGLLLCGGRPLIAYAIEVLKPLCGQLLINANRSQESYKAFGFPVIADTVPGFQGPLAGILTVLQAADTPYLIAIPCDSPRLQSTTLTRLLKALVETSAQIALAHDGERLHPVILALRTELKDDLADYLARGERKIDRWADRHHWVAVDCSDRPEQFANINTPEDLKALERLIRTSL
ncbi:MAG: molybdenum cofactor guanylyltransferase [Methylohalobius sp.]|nr:molybdenum cofactor guanylyltransferase [Methylohalobius sp.]